MLKQNMIPGMKVHVSHSTECGGGNLITLDKNMYIVRMIEREDEFDDDPKRQTCIVNEDIYEDEGVYTIAQYLTLLELPKSFDKRNEEYLEG